jgi:hypothetical protein
VCDRSANISLNSELRGVAGHWALISFTWRRMILFSAVAFLSMVPSHPPPMLGRYCVSKLFLLVGHGFRVTAAFK